MLPNRCQMAILLLPLYVPSSAVSIQERNEWRYL